MTIEQLMAQAERCEKTIAKADAAKLRARQVLDLLGGLYWRKAPLRHREILADSRFTSLCVRLVKLA